MERDGMQSDYCRIETRLDLVGAALKGAEHQRNGLRPQHRSPIQPDQPVARCDCA